MKKEHYRHILPHYQLPGQAYFVTWCLKDAIPPKALKRYTQKLVELKNQREYHKTINSDKKIQDKIAQEYYATRRKYIKAFDDLLHVKDEAGEPVYLEDIMHSVKRFSANEINKLENREGKLWQKESFDTTINNSI